MNPAALAPQHPLLSSRFPDLAALEVLIVVGRAGSTNAAAAVLGRTQQAVSSRIISLEAQVGVPLLYRAPQGSRLTPNGALVAEWASRLLSLAHELDASFAALRHDRAAHLHVAASLTIAEQLLPRWLTALHSANATEVRLTATNSETVARLVREGRADLGFVEGPRAPAGCRSKVIAHDDLVVVVPQDHPWAARPDGVTADVLASTSLVMREEGSGTRESLQVALARAALVPAPPTLILSTSAAVRTAVLAGAGPAVLSELVVAADLAAGTLRRVPVAGLDLRRSLRAVWIGARTPPAGPVRDVIAVASASDGERVRRVPSA